jgi:hypothetical protein
VVEVFVLGRFDGSNDVVVSVLLLGLLLLGLVPDVVEVSPGLMSVVTGGLVLVMVSVLLSVVVGALLPEALGSGKYCDAGAGSVKAFDA